MSIMKRLQWNTRKSGEDFTTKCGIYTIHPVVRGGKRNIGEFSVGMYVVFKTSILEIAFISEYDSLVFKDNPKRMAQCGMKDRLYAAKEWAQDDYESTEETL